MERSTKQRAAIWGAISDAHRPLLPQEILEFAQSHAPGLGIATVYRTLKSLTEEGVVRAVQLPGQNTRFELAAHSHHHHFQCRGCEKVFDVYACPPDLSALAPAGFRVEEHDITLFGVCRECDAKVPTQQHRGC